MSNVVLSIFVAVLQYVSVPAHAYDLKYSARTETWDNPFIAYGYNPKTKKITGYLAALRTAPGRTDECKLIFSGNEDAENELLVTYLGKAGSSEKQSRLKNRVSVVVGGDSSYLKFSKKNLVGDCDWILPFVVESELSESSDEVLVEMEVQHAGEWISVYAIGAQKARFYSRPDSSSVLKSFLVNGDVIYVYDEQADWYFVKFEEGRRKIEGWIRKVDTLQP